jgi:2-oxoglutarate ferredoxin oxidoreductase subunit delta
LSPVLKRDSAKDVVRIEVCKNKCLNCGICVEFCTRRVLGKGEMGEPIVLKPERCTVCRLCELRCPEACITITSHQLTSVEG